MTNARHDDNDELGEQIGGRPSRIGIADTGIATDNGARRQKSRKGDSFGYRIGSRVVNYVNVRRLEIWVSELKFPLNCQSDNTVVYIFPDCQVQPLGVSPGYPKQEEDSCFSGFTQTVNTFCTPLWNFYRSTRFANSCWKGRLSV